jgi:AGZA family xanthine/uracil permease-like MFS transporter
MIANYPPITASALVIVGCMMMRNASHIDWQDQSEAIPAFLIAVGIPLTYSIADGLAIGFILYPFIKIIGRRWQTMKWLSVLLSLILLLYFFLVRVRI